MNSPFQLLDRQMQHGDEGSAQGGISTKNWDVEPALDAEKRGGCINPYFLRNLRMRKRRSPKEIIRRGELQAI